MGCLQLPSHLSMQPQTDSKSLPATTLPQHPPDTLEHLEFVSPTEIPYTHLANLGKGKTSVVEKVLHTPTNIVYARKCHTIHPRSRRNGALAAQLHAFKNEIDITRRLARHPHIVRVVASYSTHETLAVILSPAADGGDLRSFLALYPAVADPSRKASMAATLMHAYGCLASGLAFMHAHRIRHRDIKPENILIHRGAVLFADFGVSRDYSGAEDSATDGTPGAYTPRYCAPEVRDHGRRTSKSDVFSLGIVFLLVYVAMIGGNAVVEMVEREKRFYEHIEDIGWEMEGWTEYAEVVECLRGMVRVEEVERMSAGEVVSVLRRGGGKYFCGDCVEEDVKTELEMDMTRKDSTNSTSSDLSGVTLASDTDRARFLAPHDEKVISKESKEWVVRTSPKSVPINIIEIDPSITSLQEQVSVPAPPPPSQPGRDSMVSVLSEKPVYPHSTSLKFTVDDSLSKAHLACKVAKTSHSESIREVHPAEVPLQHTAQPDTAASTYPPLTLLPPATQHTSFQSGHPIPFFTHHRMLRTSKLQLPSPSDLNSNPASSGSSSECVLYEDRIYDFALKKLGIGIRLSNRYPYGSILPSLRTFPIVPAIMQEWEFFKTGSLFEVQKALATGALHPYMQDEMGYNLLHLAIQVNRLDISTHLHTLGVLPTPTHSGQTIFQSALLLNSYAPPPSSSIIANLRFLLTQCDHQPDFTSAKWKAGQNRLLFPDEVTHWLSTAGVEYGLDAGAVEELCLRVALRRAQLYVPRKMDAVEKMLKRYMTPGIVRRIKQDGMLLVDDLFAAYGGPRPELSLHETFALGALWLRVLAAYAVDIPTYLLQELDAHPGSLLPSAGTQAHDRRLTMGLTEDGQFVLGWEMVLSDRAPGALLVSEFGVLGNVLDIGEWPFAEWEQEGGVEEAWRVEEKRMRRFWRKRMKREGRYVVDRMPGSWVE